MKDYHNKILFTSDRSGKLQLYMIKPNGKDLENLTGDKYHHWNGVWSPDARKIVCNTSEETEVDGGNNMVMMNSDGSKRILLGTGNRMSWYPDGSKIFYNSSFPFTGFNSVDSNGKSGKRVSDIYFGNHTIHPDGSNILFVTVMTIDSLARFIMVDYPQFDNPRYIGPVGGNYPRFSPNGEEISFSKKEGENKKSDIFVMDSDGSNIRKITNNTSDMSYSSARWSPKNDKLIFIAIAPDGRMYLYMINIDGTNLHRIIEDDYIYSCDWSK